MLLLSKGAEVNSYVDFFIPQGHFELTPLHCSLMDEKYDTAHLLLDMGANAKNLGLFLHPASQRLWKGNALEFCTDKVNDNLKARIKKDIQGL